MKLITRCILFLLARSTQTFINFFGVTFSGSAADKIVELISNSCECKQRQDSKPKSVVTPKLVVTTKPVVTTKSVVTTKPVVTTTTKLVVTTTPVVTTTTKLVVTTTPVVTTQSVVKTTPKLVVTTKPVVTTGSKTVVTTTPKPMENPHPACKVSRPSDCSALNGTKCKSGVYKTSGFKVYCDMETNGGGWTVFQRRKNGKTDFYREWEPYKHGFGKLTEEFWLGNEFIHQMSAQGNCILWINLEDFENKKRFAEYKKFYVGDEKSGYKLTVTGYHGNAGNGMVYFANGQKFSTKDRDNDISTGSSADFYKGAWWYKNCHQSNLNGLYLKGSHKSYADGVVWYPWHGYNHSLKSTSMMLRKA